MVDDQLLQKKSRWRSLADVSDFPMKDFTQLRREISSGGYRLILDRTLVSQLAVIFGGRLGSLIYLSLRVLMIGMLIGLILAVRAGYLLTMWGVLLSFIALALSSRLRWLVGALVLLSPIGLVITIPTKHYDLASLIVGVLTPLSLLWLTNRANKWLVKRAALSSEAAFLYLYERGVVAVKDNSSKKVYYCMDSARGNEFA